MNAFFLETTPGMRGVSVSRPRGGNDLEGTLDRIEASIQRTDALIDRLSKQGNQLREKLDGGSFDGTHIDDARTIEAKLARAESVLS